MTEEQQASGWVLFLIGFCTGLPLGMIVIAICAGWYDEVMKLIEKKKKKSR